MNKETKPQTNGELMIGRRFSGEKLADILKQHHWTIKQFTRILQKVGHPDFKPTEALIYSYVKGQSVPSTDYFLLIADSLGLTHRDAIKMLCEERQVN